MVTSAVLFLEKVFTGNFLGNLPSSLFAKRFFANFFLVIFKIGV